MMNGASCRFHESESKTCQVRTWVGFTYLRIFQQVSPSLAPVKVQMEAEKKGKNHLAELQPQKSQPASTRRVKRKQLAQHQDTQASMM